MIRACHMQEQYLHSESTCATINASKESQLVETVLRNSNNNNNNENNC
jgi:hypothetical protein